MKKKNKKRKICILSGKRGGFGSLIRTMRLIEEDPNLEMQLVVTDMHLSKKFGKTLFEVAKNFPVDGQIDMKQKSGSSSDRSVALGIQMAEMTKMLKKLQPDIFLCLGDRGEVLVSVIAANNLGIPVAHVQGGDISGNLDEVFRHAITKMAHIHFPSTPDAGKRIEKMGEEKKRIHVVGDTHLDLIAAKEFTPGEHARARYTLDAHRPFLMVLQHSVTTEPEKSYDQMKKTLTAVAAFKMPTLVVYPCSDQGYDGIIKAIKEFKDVPHFSIYKNIEAQDFLGLLSEASALIGNSSSGIIEAPLFRLPVVNIGSRQRGRLRDKNVIDVPNGAVPDIKKAITKAINDTSFRASLKQCGTVYGKGKSAEKIVKVLKSVELGPSLFEKRMTY
ncbi:UDP-N-acetylglucosamine 2-epimerase (hydrolyzing) [Candidatus Kaiserbacteria bacterium CG10_big_fil_rev_8_21_14_0_10_49_17]|uniref:UDP-N-acetylglucosamine 2-epimerase (Hydrolyzing) n=1 Tax=Candidatus Kaiserbacteria bacterium CG10_big_fil_rev_8_21_14_0_10_49_17 TaxID=1974609 RepID=A0A2M6WDY1_9BACT|nr:MAG: UDP-N-acetylglucosamine 2-epimerase (hydrolyzing) [Candidatus Kaiserbacteria bacterium CG10_big_fil_rev_8_21_14_0_10_49_17]